MRKSVLPSVRARRNVLLVVTAALALVACSRGTTVDEDTYMPLPDRIEVVRRWTTHTNGPGNQIRHYLLRSGDTSPDDLQRRLRRHFEQRDYDFNEGGLGVGEYLVKIEPVRLAEEDPDVKAHTTAADSDDLLVLTVAAG